MKRIMDAYTNGFSNAALIEALYQKYLEDPESVDLSWRYFFDGIRFSDLLSSAEEPKGKTPLRILQLIQAYRRLGYLAIEYHPLHEKKRKSVAGLSLKELGFDLSELEELFPTLGILSEERAPLKKIVEALEKIYCNEIGFEYLDSGNLELEAWLQKEIEPNQSQEISPEEKYRILASLNASEVLETFLHTKYVGQKRFSLEGCETLLPVLQEILAEGARLGVEEEVLGMAHRGRLNVLSNFLQKPYEVIFKEFEDTIPLLDGESGDVKYHKGYSSDVEIQGKSVHLHLCANSSCLESVDGIALGEVKARQIRRGDALKVLGVIIHGDAAIAGQGVVYETLQMSHIPGFSTGGTIHIALNNQIGFTTPSDQGRSTKYCTDIAKTFGCPVFHVSTDHPESCMLAARLAVQIRQQFGVDVFIDLNGYRKYGHNETDEPAFTQPIETSLIRKRKTLRESYRDALLAHGSLDQKMAKELESAFQKELISALEFAKNPKQSLSLEQRFGIAALSFKQPSWKTLFEPTSTALSVEVLEGLLHQVSQVPADFSLHPKLEKLLQQRKKRFEEDALDWATAEVLAISSLLSEKIPVRLAGQDSIRGTFSQRQAVWFDQKTAEAYAPFKHVKEGQAQCQVYNTILSEFGALAFEFGYSWSALDTLVMWEAQYGDFVIGGQIPIDHYIAAAEQKWARYSNLILLLPHGYEGGGPEHSSARIERFLALTANGNFQVTYPTTPAQYFHLLRRQMHRKIKKPLVLFTPKSLLRHPKCISSKKEFSEASFEEILEDPTNPKEAKRLFLCTGKIYYDLLEERASFMDAAIIRIEQLYPLHEEKLKICLEKYPQIEEVIWVQEEPQNMGAYPSLAPLLQPLLSVSFSYVGREVSGATATGSMRVHEQEKQQIFQRLRQKP